MKKLSIEEKAKAYDEAINRLEDIKTGKCQKTFVFTEGLFDYIFPELKESEDESMIQYFKDLAPFDNADELYEKYGFSHKDAIAWLEKQGEHANFLSKIQAGDKVTRNEDGVLVNLSQLNRVANKQGEQKLLYVNDNAKEMFIKALERVEEQNKKGYKLTDCDKNSWWEDFKAYTSCIIEQKPAAWSKEDEKQARQIERIVHDGCTQKLQKQIADWFESLKERYTWKPSKEQMNTLEYYMHTLICNEHKEVLFGLYADLKKLMEK